MAYNRTIHRYQVFPSRDISISINENPRSKQNFNTIRLLSIPTSSDDFDRYIESQITLNKLNANLSEEDKIEQESELKRKLIDNSIEYLQSSRKNEKECAYFEYDNGNSKIARTCINRLKGKYERNVNHEPTSIEEVQHILLEQDIPIGIAKELVVILLKHCFSATAAVKNMETTC
jgi:signal recognition particle GTPase